MKQILLLSICSFFVTANLPEARAAEPPKPNILIIFTDDQGYADLGCTGSKTNKTPRLDKLAEEGTRFTSFYAQAVCGPSRSALLTGRYPFRSGGWTMPADEVTWAELIPGYQTACIGKWDVSGRKPILDQMPLAQGFDYYFGPLGANDAGKVTFHDGNDPAGGTDDMASLLKLYTDKAIDYLKVGRDKNKPFVLYLAHTMMHTIIDASPQFRGTSAGSLYGDVVEEFDYETGRLLDVLDELDLADNTLVIYTSDNGPWNQPAYTDHKQGHPEGAVFWGDAGPLRNGKGSPYEAGYRVPCIVRWPGKVPAGKVSDAIFSTLDFLPTFAHLTGFDVPTDRVIDGVDQTDLLLGNSRNGARDNFLYKNNAVRKGKWKYLRAKHDVHGFAQDKQRPQVEELYDLEADLGERNNLAAKHPEKVAELKALMDTIRQAKVPDGKEADASGSSNTTGAQGKEAFEGKEDPQTAEIIRRLVPKAAGIPKDQFETSISSNSVILPKTLDNQPFSWILVTENVLDLDEQQYSDWLREFRFKNNGGSPNPQKLVKTLKKSIDSGFYTMLDAAGK